MRKVNKFSELNAFKKFRTRRAPGVRLRFVGSDEFGPVKRLACGPKYIFRSQLYNAWTLVQQYRDEEPRRIHSFVYLAIAEINDMSSELLLAAQWRRGCPRKMAEMYV